MRVIRMSGLQSDVVFFKGYAEDIQQYIVFLIRMGEGGVRCVVNLQIEPQHQSTNAEESLKPCG